MLNLRRLGSIVTIFGLAAAGVASAPHEAKARWRGDEHVGVWIPPVIVAPPPISFAPPRVYLPPPVAYHPYPEPRRMWVRPAAPRVWVPPHWQGPYWVRGHWS